MAKWIKTQFGALLNLDHVRAFSLSLEGGEIVAVCGSASHEIFIVYEDAEGEYLPHQWGTRCEVFSDITNFVRSDDGLLDLSHLKAKGGK